jgi:hypothetical protein
LVELSLTEITERLGYSTLPNFARAFRRWTGQTPAAYRRALTALPNLERGSQPSPPFSSELSDSPHEALHAAQHVLLAELQLRRV